MANFKIAMIMTTLSLPVVMDIGAKLHYLIFTTPHMVITIIVAFVLNVLMILKYLELQIKLGQHLR